MWARYSKAYPGGALVTTFNLRQGWVGPSVDVVALVTQREVRRQLQLGDMAALALRDLVERLARLA
jgi:hypothetical protein